MENMEKVVYLDNAATTPCAPEALEMMVKALSGACGNPSSHYSIGYEAKEFVDTGRAQVAKAINASPAELFFTSCGSEADNWAVKGTAFTKARQNKKHLITSAFEHHAIMHSMAALERMGFEVTYLPVDHLGHISLEDLEKAIREDTILVSVMYVNNEVGAVEPIEEISQIIKAKNPSVIFHVDAIQAYGKYVIRPKKQGIDLLSVSGHKIHGPKGVGFLYIRSGVKIKPLIYGGGQQNNLRSGTENVPGAAGLGVAAREMYTDHEEKIRRLTELKDYMTDRLGEIEGTLVNSKKGTESAPQIVSVSFEGVRSEVLLHALEEKKIYVSAGSACSSKKKGSSVLSAMGLSDVRIEGAIRFSFSRYNTVEEAEECLRVLKEKTAFLRKYMR